MNTQLKTTTPILKTKALLAALILACSTGFSQTPNILLIIADDVGVDCFNGYLNSPILPTTPTLDSLRNSGLTFENAWATPTCTPTRATIMSGKYGIKTGVLGAPGHLDVSHTSIFKELEIVTSNAYSDAAFGKWHISLPADPNHPGDHSIDHYDGILDAGWNGYNDWEHTSAGVTSTNTDYMTTVFTDSAINWINQQSGPWFTWLAYTAPHSPFHEPPAGMYTINPIGTNFRKYIAMIETLDYEIRRLLNSLDPAELANTVIFFIGDNGTPKNLVQHYTTGMGKSTLYQGGVHVPMFVCGDGVTRVGERENAMVHVNDMYATILDLNGANLPGGIYNSLSFNHLLTGSAGPTKDYNYTELTQDTTTGYAIRSSQYKLIHHASGYEEFYDLSIDTFETNNIIATYQP